MPSSRGRLTTRLSDSLTIDSMSTLKDLLGNYVANVLKQIAREHELDVTSKNKRATVELLVKRLAEREEVERALTRVGHAEREILGLAQRAGGEVATSALEKTLKKSRSLAAPRKRDPWQMYEPIKGDPKYRGKPTLEDAAAHLALIGLAFAREVAGASYGKQVIGWELGRYLVIPEEIRGVLPSFAESGQTSVSEPTRIVPGSARNLQRDLSRYWSFVRREGKLDLTVQGWVYKKIATELGKALGWNDKSRLDEKDHSYFFFLRKMLEALDLAHGTKADEWGNLIAADFTASDEHTYWAQPPAGRVQQAFAAYLDATTWNELRVPPAAYGMDHRRPAPKELKSARRIVIEKIKKRGAGSWVALEDLIQDVRLGNYEFLFPRDKRNQPYYGYPGNYSTPYYQPNNPYGVTYNKITDEASGWDQVEGAIITHIITGPLHWLGLIDVGFDGDRPIAYRLTPLGAWLLGLGAELHIAQEGGRIVVQPNFQIVAMEPIAENVLMTLDEFAQFEGGDRALTYGLTRESVYRGQRAGWDAARIITYLEDATRTPLPQNVRRSLEEWQALHERITIRRGISLLQAEDVAALDELFANATLAHKLGRRVGPNVALTSENAASLNTALRDAGWLTVFTRRDQTDAPGSVTTDENGSVTFVHRTPSIYAYEGIEPFTEQIDVRHARITPASVAAAAQQGLVVPAMIERLRQVHRGEIPARMMIRLKAWGKYFGRAKLGTLTLIEFRDEQARSELLDDAELKPYLERFEAGNRPLALVRAGALERVKGLLAERGVEIREWSS